VHSCAVKCAWKDSNAFVVLNYGAERSDRHRLETMEFASA